MIADTILAIVGCLLMHAFARWLLTDDDAPADAPCYPLCSYRPCRMGDCGELRLAGARVLLTRRVPHWCGRTQPN